MLNNCSFTNLYWMVNCFSSFLTVMANVFYLFSMHLKNSVSLTRFFLTSSHNFCTGAKWNQNFIKGLVPQSSYQTILFKWLVVIKVRCLTDFIFYVLLVTCLNGCYKEDWKLSVLKINCEKTVIFTVKLHLQKNK